MSALDIPVDHEQPSKVTRYGLSGAREFRIGSVKISVEHLHERKVEVGTEADALVSQVAEWCRDSVTQLARADALLLDNYARWESARCDLVAKIHRLEDQLNEHRARHPEKPARVLGPLCVRMQNGELWALNKRETGWSSSGFLVGSWDELFRRWDVIVTEHGVDKHGAYWMCEPTKKGGA